MKHLDGHPLIGISVGTGLAWRRLGGYFRSYASAVEDAGGVCTPLGSYASKHLEKCDGLLVPGGWDVHPETYDRLPGDQNLSLDELMDKYRIRCEPKRDESELPFIRQALDMGLPILAICRGIQALNVVLARKLIPDIPTCVPDALRHRSVGPAVSHSHEVEVEPDSVIERAYGTRKLVVNTRHHQGLIREFVSDRLCVTAIAPDGVVEAVEGVGSQFIVGVQWHPERRKDGFINGISGPLFRAFVQACRRQV